jgi:hypothetical protein
MSFWGKCLALISVIAAMLYGFFCWPAIVHGDYADFFILTIVFVTFEDTLLKIKSWEHHVHRMRKIAKDSFDEHRVDQKS